MPVGSVESGLGDGYQAAVDSGNRLLTKSTLASGAGDGYLAAVDASGRLLTRSSPDPSGQTLYTSVHTVNDSSVTTIADTRANRTRLIIQNQLTVPIAVRFASADPGSSEFRIAAGATFELDSYTGQARAQAVSGTTVSGTVIVLERVGN